MIQLQAFSGRRLRATAAAATVLMLGAAACAPAPPSAPVGHANLYITADGSDSYSFTPSPGSMVIRADRRNKGSNTRTLIWDTGRAASVDQAACTTFTNDTWPTQEGVALRVSADGHPGRAITVMKNIYGSATTRFNVQLIDMTLPAERGRITPAVPSAEFAAALAGPTQP